MLKRIDRGDHEKDRRQNREGSTGAERRTAAVRNVVNKGSHVEVGNGSSHRSGAAGCYESGWNGLN